MDKVQVKVYMLPHLAEKLDEEHKKSGESKSHIVSESVKKELKRRGK